MNARNNGGFQTNLKVELALFAVLALLWGSSYLFIKVAVAEIPPLTLVATRVTIAAAFLFTVLKLRGDRLPREAKTWRMLLVQSVFSAIAAWTVLAWGQQFVDASLASVLNSTAPIFVFLFTAFITRHEHLDALKLVGAIIGIVGVCLIVGVDALGGLGRNVLGQFACLLGAVLYACAAIYGKRFASIAAPISPTATAAGTMIWATIVLLPIALVVDAPWHLKPSATAIGAALMLSVFCTGIAMLLYFRLVRTLGSLGTSSQAYLRAGVGVLLGVLVLGEQLTLVVALGLGIAILGVVLINWPRGRKRA